jgi:hypothetical protein
VRASWRSSLLAGAGAALVAAPLQAPNYRVTYRLRVLESAGPGGPRLVASGVVTGPPETALKLALRRGAVTLHALLATLPEPDTVNLAAVFLSRRPGGRSRRRLPLWEEDSYRRSTRLAWGGTVRLDPFGPAGARERHALWIELSVGREFAAGETRPSEEVSILDDAVAFAAEAVVPPRRVTVRMALVRGDTASAPRAVDLVPEAPGRRVAFVLGRERRDFDVSLERPQPPRTSRDSALAVGADEVCLRLLTPGAEEPARMRCGRLGNVARRLALPGGDTLVAIFAWPAVR